MTLQPIIEKLEGVYRRSSYAEVGKAIEELREAEEKLVLSTVVGTLRAVVWLDNSDEGRTYVADTIRDVELRGADPMCCPLCEETTCDGGCPLASLREKAMARG